MPFSNPDTMTVFVFAASEAVSSIQKASAIIHEKTCVRWVQLKVEDALKEKNYVHFKKGNG
jgi:hypothetical protein